MHQFNEKLEKELKKIYIFFVQQERELYLKINYHLHARIRYEEFSMIQINKELDELQNLSNLVNLTSNYIYINITGMSKILKKFDKKFKRFNLNFEENFIIEKYKKKNSDLLYINQYKIIDEVGACLDQLYFELKEQYDYLINNPIKEENNMRTNLLNEKIREELKSDDDNSLYTDSSKEEKLISDNESNNKYIVNDNESNNKDLVNDNGSNNKDLVNDNENNNIDLSNDKNETIKNKFQKLKQSMKYIEIFYRKTAKIFKLWKRYLNKNDYKSRIYSVKNAGEIADSDSKISNDIEKNNCLEKNKIDKKVQHYLSRESYWNIRIILAQALVMSITSTYILPKIFYLLKHKDFLKDEYIIRLRKGYYCGLIIAMSPLGGLFSMLFSHFIIKKSYKAAIILSSVLSLIGNFIFIEGITYSNIYLICIGRLLTGFSLNTPVHRNYLLYFIPKRRMKRYLLYFKLIVLLGNSLGPLLSFICFLFKDFKFKNKSLFNKYTMPGWICLFASLILLIIIILLFSEPLSSKFIIYGEGQAPVDIMKSNDAFSLDNNLTIYEAEKLNKIDQNVKVVNEENQFNDTNLVSKTINELVEMEIEPGGTVRKAFWVILFYVFILNFTQFCYITMSPAYLHTKLTDIKDKKISRKILVSFYYFICLLLIIPTFCFNFFYISLRLDEIYYIIFASLIFLLSEFITSFLIINNTFYPLFFVILLLTILLAYIVEDQLIYFYTHIIPTNFKLGKLEGLTVLHIMKYLGCILGSSSSLFGFLSYSSKDEDEEKNIEKFMFWQNLFDFLIQFILLCIFLYYYRSFQDRPIRRIIYSQNKREILITEF